MIYNHKKIEDKWRKKWREKGVYKVDLKNPKKKFYNLMMFPYPSAEGLHVGNMYAFTGADLYGRFKAMQGNEVFEPIGLDGFGIHSENYAIKIGKHPAEQAKISEKRYYEQLERIGNRFNWDNRLETYDPEYYKWTQWLFIQMFKQGLAYRKKSLVNWCPSCKTVLADEQVEGGVCERCKQETEKKETYQWFFKITDYAQRLLDNIDKIDWPEKIKTAQRNWIGRKEGIDITYKIKGLKEIVTCFTTTPVNWGASFIVISPEYKVVEKIVKGKIKVKKKEVDEVKKYVETALKKTDQQRLAEEKKKTGVFTGLYAINQVTKEEMPVWVADFVLGQVGTGAVQGCPGHDVRDFEFAKKYGIKIPRVVMGPDGDKSEIDSVDKVIVSGMPGKMVNSEFLNGVEFAEAMQKTMDYFEEKGWGKRVISYHLRDWCISRQRYWGPPIPMMECGKCGWVPEKEENLPVKLPMVKEYKPTGDGKSPLEKASKDWLETKCSKCGGKAKRETDVSDTFLDSAWYFLRYPSVKSDKQVFDKELAKKWLPVDAYIGGAEHAVLHLMYSRFVTMALKDWGYLNFEEPFPFLYGHGLIIKDGAKMSKSRGNVVIPDEYIDKHGVDALRMYLMFIGPYDHGGDFKDTGMIGMKKFLERVWRLVEKPGKVKNEKQLRNLQHKTVKIVTKAMEKLRYNVGIARLMEYVNGLQEAGVDKEALEALVLMLAPVAPYVAEEMWGKLGGKFSVHQQGWPKYDEALAKGKKVTVVVQVNGKLRGRLEVGRDEAEDKEKMVGMAKKDERVGKFVKGKKVVKEVFVKGKLVNLVVK